MASTGNPLHDAKCHIIGLIRTAYDKEKSNEERSRNLQREIDELEKERLILEKECAELEIRKDELEKKSSASSEARKMYGDVTSGDITHQDVVLSYQNHFTAAHRNLPKILDLPTKEAKFEAWTEASEIVEQSFDENKKEIVAEMITKLRTALTNPPPTDKPLDANTSDLYKAFKLYLKKNDDKIKHIITKNSPQEYNEATMFHFARDIIMQLDPEDYHSFISEGKKRPKNYPHIAADSAAISKTKVENKRKNKCHACGKGFELEKGDSPTYHLGYYWHQRHCYCVGCHKLVDENFVYYKNRSSYCSHCLCCKCHKPIHDEDAFLTEQGQFHRSCLVCRECHTFRKQMFQIGNDYICKRCAREKNMKM